jgi:hypothetical protein
VVENVHARVDPAVRVYVRDSERESHYTINTNGNSGHESHDAAAIVIWARIGGEFGTVRALGNACPGGDAVLVVQ